MSLGSASFVVTADTGQFVQGMAQAQQAAQKMSTSVKASLDQAADSMRRFQVGFAPMGKAVEEVRERLHTFSVALPGMSSGMAAAETSSRHLGYGFYALGQAVDDVQYGFSAIVNNIPQIAMLFGGSAGIAGAVAIAAVAINQLVKHWGDLTDILNSAWSGKPLEELRKVREAAEQAAEAWERLEKAPTKLQARSAKAIEEAITEAPAEAMHKAVDDALRQSPHGTAFLNEAERARVTDLQDRMELMQKQEAEMAKRPGAVRVGGGGPAVMGRLIDEIRAAAVKRILSEATLPGKTGDAARRNIQTMMREQPHLFPPEARAQFGAATPEGLKAGDEFRKQQEVRAEVQKKIKRAEEEHAHKLEEQLGAERRLIQQRQEVERARIDEGQKAAGARRQVDDLIKAEKDKEWKRLRVEAEKRQQINEKDRREADRQFNERLHRIRDEQQRDRQNLDVRRRINQILAGAMPGDTRSQIMGHAEFQRFTSTGILNTAADVQQKQLEALREIRQILKDRADERAGQFGAIAAAGHAIGPA